MFGFVARESAMKNHLSSILSLVVVLAAALISTSGCVVHTRGHDVVYADGAPPARVYYGGYDLHYRSNAYYYYDGGTWLLAPSVPSYLVRYHRPYYTSGYRTYSRPYTTTRRPTYRYSTPSRPATTPGRRVTNTSPRRYSTPATRGPTNVSRPARTSAPPRRTTTTTSRPSSPSRPTGVSRPPASRSPASSGGAPRRVTRH